MDPIWDIMPPGRMHADNVREQNPSDRMPQANKKDGCWYVDGDDLAGNLHVL